MYPYQMIAGGEFTLTTSSGSTVDAVDVICVSQNPPDLILTKSITQWGAASKPQAIEWWWERIMAQGTAKGILQGSSAASPPVPALNSFFVASNGISTYDFANPLSFSPLVATAINGTTFVVSMANTGNISVGDYVRIVASTGALQLAGYTFQVTAVTTNTSITLGYMASSGTTLAANATAASIVKTIPNKFYPKEKRIVNITQATQAVVFFGQKNDFTPGERVSFRVPPQWGMTQLNNVKARVLSVTNSTTVSSITIDLDTTGFSAFVFPTSAIAAAGISPALAIPSESWVVPDPTNTSLVQQPPGTNLLDAFDNRNTRVIHFGGGLFNIASNVSTVGDVWAWVALKYDLLNNN